MKLNETCIKTQVSFLTLEIKLFLSIMAIVGFEIPHRNEVLI